VCQMSPTTRSISSDALYCLSTWIHVSHCARGIDYSRSAINYCRLVMGCFGFQQTFEKGKQSVDRDFMNKVSLLVYSILTRPNVDIVPSGRY
jgi:hypothetical protein